MKTSDLLIELENILIYLLGCGRLLTSYICGDCSTGFHFAECDQHWVEMRTLSSHSFLSGGHIRCSILMEVRIKAFCPMSISSSAKVGESWWIQHEPTNFPEHFHYSAIQCTNLLFQKWIYQKRAQRTKNPWIRIFIKIECHRWN